jgi:hypothetical protein
MTDQTRRSWMVTISQAAVGLGLSGSTQAHTQDPQQLPPGLYLPSSDHLSHALMSTEQFHAVPPGCPTDYIRPRTRPFSALFFSASEFAVIRRLIGLLLGEVSTGDENGHESIAQDVAEWIDLRVWSADGVRAAALSIHPLYRDLAVAYYGAAQVRQVEVLDPADTCRQGLAWMNAIAQAQHSKEFLALETEQQVAVLDTVSDERADKQLRNSGTRFFDFLKTETIKGFYTSEGGLKELDFKGNAFYARSPGCDSQRR